MIIITSVRCALQRSPICTYSCLYKAIFLKYCIHHPSSSSSSCQRYVSQQDIPLRNVCSCKNLFRPATMQAVGNVRNCWCSTLLSCFLRSIGRSRFCWYSPTYTLVYKYRDNSQRYPLIHFSLMQADITMRHWSFLPISHLFGVHCRKTYSYIHMQVSI